MVTVPHEFDGNQGHFVFTIDTTDYEWVIRSSDRLVFTRPPINNTALLTTNYEALLPANLVQISELRMEINWQHSAGQQYRFQANLPPLNATGTGRLYVPPGRQVNGVPYLEGSGWISRYEGPAMINGERQTGVITFQFDSEAEPTWQTVSIP